MNVPSLLFNTRHRFPRLKAPTSTETVHFAASRKRMISSVLAVRSASQHLCDLLPVLYFHSTSKCDPSTHVRTTCRTLKINSHCRNMSCCTSGWWLTSHIAVRQKCSNMHFSCTTMVIFELARHSCAEKLWAAAVFLHNNPLLDARVVHL